MVTANSYFPSMLSEQCIASDRFRRTTDSRKEKRMTKPYVRLDKNDAAVLLVDHQAGLLSLVRDIEPDKFKNNVLALSEYPLPRR